MNALTATRHIEQSYRSYLRTTFAPRRASWRAAFEDALANEMDLTRGPYLEATPPFVPGATPRALIDEGLLSRDFARMGADVFPLDRHLYAHQERSVRAALAGRNLLVATGTGSGKTECVLIPTVEELLREARAGTLGQPGVRTLLLYPMNALANDQLRRFRDWLAAFPEITFGRFVGDTKHRYRDALEVHRAIHGREPLPNELICRDDMRERPPHILVTNYSMLEYLLLRPEDSRFFDGPTAGHWRRIALDEAHVYDGADGAEVAMLLRRLRDRIVGSRPGALQVVATSATLGRGEQDIPALVRFGEDLFDEPFEARDIIGPLRLPLAGTSTSHPFPDETYARLAALVRDAEETSATLTGAMIRELLPAGSGNGHRSTDDEPGAALYDAFVGDTRLVALQRALDAQGVLTIEEAAGQLFDDVTRTADIVDLVDLGVRARQRPADAPLLPARYHYWLRGLEGGFACLHPAHRDSDPPFMLKVANTCPGCEAAGVRSMTVELGACRYCRADYAIGTGALGNQLRRVGIGQVPTAYFLLDERADDADEDVEDEGLGEAAEADAWYCPGCGWLLEGAVGPCDCPDTPPTRRGGVLVTVGGDDPRLRRCLACGAGARGGNVVGRFLTDAHAPAAIIATALYQELPAATAPLAASKSGEGRKLLAFSDSRQDAAFFAPYLDRTYGRALRRSLLLAALETVDDTAGSSARDLVAPLDRLASQHLLIEGWQKPAARLRAVLTWTMEEIIAVDRRQSLAGVGLVRVGPSLPAAVPVCLSPLGLPDPLARELLGLLLDTLRVSGAVRMPTEVVRGDEVFRPLDHDIVVRGRGDEGAHLVSAWTPKRNNRRRDLLLKVAQAVGRDVDPLAVLDDLWTELTSAGSAWDHLLPHELDRRRGTVRRLDAEMIEFVLARHAGTRYRCDVCRSLWWSSVAGVCPTFNCSGRLVPLDASESLGHYAEVYRALRPMPMYAKEHTAQWALDKGTDVQQRFLDGDINVLSCSTTFELGVDVGDVEGVLLRNVPPSAANYIQRAGRAGRRTSAAALVVTVAQRRNHDMAWFRDPRGMVGGAVVPPRIVTENPIIARRHAHSVAVASFLRQEPEIRTVGDLFETRDASDARGIERFLAWLDTRPVDLQAALARILPGPALAVLDLAGWGWVTALTEPTDEDPSSGWLTRADQEVVSELEALDGMWAEARDMLDLDRTDGAALKRMESISRQIRTLRNRWAIGFLAQRNVLPKYGFPVDVVELDLSASGDQAADGIELDRDLRIAIGEYAPGAEIVANGVAWRSTGLKRFRDRGWPEHGWAVCDDCERYREAVGGDPADTCACGSASIRESGRRLRPVFGFYGERSTTVIGDEPVLRRNVSRSWFTEYGPGDPPVATTPTSIVPGSARTLVSRQGRIVAMSLGPGGRGYRVCSSCGFGAPVPSFGSAGKRSKSAATHASPWSKRSCSGTLRVVQLSTDFLTDIVEVQLGGLHPEGDLRSSLYALLEGAGAEGIKRDEIDGTTHSWNRDSRSIVLFDTVPGGAGHALRIDERFGAVVEAAIARLEACDCGLDTSCYGCLRSYSNQLWHDRISRGAALAVLRPLVGRAGADAGDAP